MQLLPLRHVVTSAAAVVAVLATLTACAGDSGRADEPGSNSNVTVVTSFYPLEYVAERIAGDRADVVNLTQPGQEPHDVELTVRETAAISEADVVLYERGFQAAVDDAVDQTAPGHVVDAAEAGDLHGDDPHFWLDPTRLAEVAAAFEDQLADADPDHRAAYERNLRSVQDDLANLDDAFENGLSECAVQTVVVSHDAFGYLGERYDLDIVSINGLSPDAEPSPAHLRELQDLIRREQVTTVFSERLASPELAESLARDLGVTTAVLDPVEGLGPDTAHEDYLSLMRSNLAALRKANSCS